MSHTVNLSLTGHLLPGHERQTTAQALASLLKVGLAQAESMLSGHAHLVRQSLTLAQAMPYLDALYRIGAEAMLQEADGHPFPKPKYVKSPRGPALEVWLTGELRPGSALSTAARTLARMQDISEAKALKRLQGKPFLLNKALPIAQTMATLCPLSTAGVILELKATTVALPEQPLGSPPGTSSDHAAHNAKGRSFLNARLGPMRYLSCMSLVLALHLSLMTGMQADQRSRSSDGVFELMLADPFAIMTPQSLLVPLLILYLLVLRAHDLGLRGYWALLLLIPLLPLIATGTPLWLLILIPGLVPVSDKPNRYGKPNESSWVLNCLGLLVLIIDAGVLYLFLVLSHIH